MPVDLSRDPWLRRFLGGIVAAMTLVVGVVNAAALFVSFAAISAFAAGSGGIDPGHARLAPLFVDAFIGIASLADLWFSISGERGAARWLPKGLLFVAVCGSFAFNVAHAAPTMPARVVASLAPASLFLTFEILLAVVRRAVRARANGRRHLALHLAGVTAPTPTPALQVAQPAPAQSPEPAKENTPDISPEEQEEIVAFPAAAAVAIAPPVSRPDAKRRTSSDVVAARVAKLAAQGVPTRGIARRVRRCQRRVQQLLAQGGPA